MSFKRFSSGHLSYIHDISYDWYGRRLATCSSDQRIKIWDLDPNTNEFKLSGEIRVNIDILYIEILNNTITFALILTCCIISSLTYRYMVIISC